MPKPQTLSIPGFLYGTAWKEERTPALVELALRTGFRGIDTANQRRHYFEAGVGEEFGDVLGGGSLAGAGVVAGVRGVDAEQVAADVDDLVLRGGRVRCHRFIVPLGAWPPPRRGRGGAGTGPGRGPGGASTGQIGRVEHFA